MITNIAAVSPEACRQGIFGAEGAGKISFLQPDALRLKDDALCVALEIDGAALRPMGTEIRNNGVGCLRFDFGDHFSEEFFGFRALLPQSR